MYIGDKEESEGGENNREVKDDPLDSSSLDGRVKCEGENQGYESSSEESVGEENNRDIRDTDESIEPTPHLRTHTPDLHLQI
jgi:hypothetical protein